MSAPVSKNHGSGPARHSPTATQPPGTPGGQASIPVALPVRVPVRDERQRVDMVWAIHHPIWAELLANGGRIRIYDPEGA